MSEPIEVLVSKIDEMLVVNRDMLAELKRMGDVTALQISHQTREIERLEKEIESAKDARKEIYKRLEHIESRCMGNHKGILGRQGIIAAEENFEAEATRWFHTQAGKAFLWGASIVAAVILTKLAGGLP
jgi:ABC-type multidrug transport system ATPase subunit